MREWPVEIAETDHPPRWQSASHGIRARRAARPPDRHGRRHRDLPDPCHRRNGQARHRRAFLGRRRDFHARGIPLRNPGQAHPRTVLPEQWRQHQVVRPAYGQGRSVRLRRRHARLRRIHQQGQVGLAPDHFPGHGRAHVGPEHEHLGRRVDAVERCLQ
ncbi:hypothetical protein D3C72_1988650 [compost metagenome]